MTGFIDYTDGKISLYFFEKNNGRYRLTDTASVTFEGEPDQSVLASLVVPGIEHIFLSIPADILSLRELDFPFSDRSKIKDTIPFELEGLLLGNTDDYSIDYLVTESSESNCRVLAACIEKTKLKDIIDLFSSVGLEPAVITSIDLRLHSNNIENIYETPSVDESKRSEAAGDELISPSINLRQKELAYKGDIELIKKSLRFTGILVLLLILVLGANITAKLISIKKDISLISGSIDAAYRDTFPSETKVINASRQFKGKLNSLRKKKDVFVGVPVLDVLLNIATIKNSSVVLDELNIDKENILLKGTAISFKKVDAFKTSLSSPFNDVKVIDSKSSPENKISFSIIMKLRTL